MTSARPVAVRRGAAAGEGTPAAPDHRDRAQGAVPGRQRAAARPGAGPAGRARAQPARPTVAVNACYLADAGRSPTSAAGRTVSVEPGPPAWARPARWPTCATGSPAGPCWSATPTPTSRRAAPPAATWPPLLDGWDGTTVRVLGVPAGRPARPSSAACASPGSRCCRPDVVAAAPAGRRSDLVLTRVAAGRAGRPAGGDRVRRAATSTPARRPTSWPPTCTPPARRLAGRAGRRR